MSQQQPSSPPRRLVRRTDDRILGGVASGLADLLGVDPVLVRVGFVLLALAGGAGVLAYLALWALTPEGGPSGRPVSRDRGAAFWVAIALFVLAGLAIADSVGDRSFVWPVVLVGAGVALWRSDLSNRSDGPVDEAGPPAPPDEPPHPASGAPTVAAPAADWTPPPPPPAGPAPQGPDEPSGWSPPPRRPRSVLGRVTVGVTLVVLGVLGALDRAGALELSAQDTVAVALLVIGVGLVVGTWYGRARWLAIPGALLLLPGLVVSSAVHDLDLPLDAGVGQQSYGTTAVAELEPLYELGAGELRLDLGDLDLQGGDAATTARVGLGQIQVVVPDDATISVTYQVTGGQVELFGNDVQGTAVERTEVFDGRPGAGELDLTVEVGFGQVEVVRAAESGSLGSFGEVRHGPPAPQSRLAH